MVKIGTTLLVCLVYLCVLGLCYWVGGQQSQLVSPCANVLLLQDRFCQDLVSLRPWYGCLSAVTYGDSLTTSQAEVPLEWIHAFYWEMGPFIPPLCYFKTESREVLT